MKIEAIGNTIFVFSRGKGAGWDLQIAVQVRGKHDFMTVRATGWEMYKAFEDRDTARNHRNEILYRLAKGETISLIPDGEEKIVIDPKDFEVQWQMPKQLRVFGRRKKK